MNRKQLNDVAYIARCSNCGASKWGIATAWETRKSMLNHITDTAQCCDHPSYWWRKLP